MPLHGFTLLTAGDGPAVAYAGSLLALLGAEVVHVGGAPSWGGLVPAELAVSDEAVLRVLPVAGAIDSARLLAGAPYPVVAAPPDPDPLTDWAASGAMALTGDPDGPPLPAPGWTAPFLRGAALTARLLARLAGADLDLDGPALLGERAAIAGLCRRGSVSVGGASRLLRCADGWLAVSLARPADFEVLEAWLGRPWHGRDPWETVAAHVRDQPGAAAVAGAQLVGLAAAVAASPEEAAADTQAAARRQRWPPSPWLLGNRSAPGGSPRRLSGPAAVPASRAPRARRAPLVVDLSALWAGPLCASLLAQAGARVVKVESAARPDGARRGPPAFFDLLNAGKRSVALDFETAAGRAELGRLLAAADIVVESARPRVMANWGFDVETLVGARHDLAWVSITGYGRTGPWQQRIGFGDDTAVAAGFTAAGTSADQPRFCADAVADPVGGLHAAVAALAAWVGGGAHLVDVALREVVGHLLTLHDEPAPPSPKAVEVSAPRARPSRGRGPVLGSDTEWVLAEVR